MSVAVQDAFQRSGHEVHQIVLNREEFSPCVGCFGCWLKTPGVCAITNDAANGIAAKAISSDAIVLLSEITYGGFSADVKAYLDRSVQNILPLFTMYKGEMHHPMRYERFPIWIAVGYGDVSDAEKQTFTLLADRNALNMRPERYLSLAVRNCEDFSTQAERMLQVLEVSA